MQNVQQRQYLLLYGLSLFCILPSVSFAEPTKTYSSIHTLASFAPITNIASQSQILGNYKRIDKRSRSSIFLGFGTLGINGGYCFGLNPTLSFSMQASILKTPTFHQLINPSKSSKIYDVRLSMMALRLQTHIHPFYFKWFHLSAGLGFEPQGVWNRIEATLPAGTYPFENKTLPFDAPVRHHMAFSSLFPTLSMGSGYTNQKGWNITFDIGVMIRNVQSFLYEPENPNDLKPEEWCGYNPDGSWLHCDNTEDFSTGYNSGEYYSLFLDQEQIGIQNYLKQYAIYPIVQLGISRSF